MKAKFQIIVPIVLITVIVIKGCLIPGWSSVCELFILSTLLGARWIISEPKVEKEPSEHDIEKMKQAVTNLASQLATLSDTINQVRNIQSQQRLGQMTGRKIG